MALLSRTDRSLIAQWWWTIDRWSLAAIATLIVSGVLLTLAASPAVAGRIGVNVFHRGDVVERRRALEQIDQQGAAVCNHQHLRSHDIGRYA